MSVGMSEFPSPGMPTSHDVGRIIRDIFYADFPLNPMLDSGMSISASFVHGAGDKQLCGDERHAHEPRPIARKDAEIQAQMPGHAPHSQSCPCAWRSASRTRLKRQSCRQKQIQPTGFSSEACRDGRRRGIAGILGGRRRSRPSRGERLKSTGPREIFRLQQIRCSCFQNP